MKDSTRRIILCAGMLLIPLFIILFGSGCAIQKFNRPPGWASAVITHERFYGIDASIPSGGGQDVLKIKLGWGSAVWTVIPVATNQVYAAKISDQFKLGQEISPFSTVITEDMVSGWEGTPPPARHLKLFGPVEKPNPVTYDTNRPSEYSYEPLLPMRVWPPGIIIHTNNIPFFPTSTNLFVITNSVNKPKP